jgi:hypothetical protein
MAGVADHDGKAFCAEATAASIAPVVVVWMFAMGSAVAGSMVWKDEVEVPDCVFPL